MKMKIRGLRWWIACLLFAATVLNYLDRQMLSLLVPTDLHMDDHTYAWSVDTFVIAYVVSKLCSGALVDRIGTWLPTSAQTVSKLYSTL